MESGIDSHTYADVDGDVLESWERQHKNDEKTIVSVLEVGDQCIAIAVDVDHVGEPIGSELIATPLTAKEARERARQWIQQHPKGIEKGGLGGLLG